MVGQNNRISRADLFDEILRDLSVLAGRVQDINQQINQDHKESVQVRIQLRNILESLTVLNGLVRGDITGHSLTTRVSLAESKLESFERERDQHLSNERQSSTQIQAVETKGLWSRRAAFVTGSLGLIGSVVSIVLHFIK